MENHHSHNHSCTHCACNNPVLSILKDELFSPENFAALPTLKAAVQQEEAQTLMITGGTIRPMIDGSVKTVPAIGIADGFIVATGTKEHVYEFMQQYHPGFATRELEPGQTLLPGLIEPHVHIVPTAMLMDWLDVGGFDGQDLRKGYGIPFVTDMIRYEVNNLNPEQWLLATGIDPALMPLQNNDTELITIDIDLLDNITDAVPVMIISASMHTLYANTPALQDIYNKNEQDPTFKKQYPSFIEYKIKTKGQLQEAEGMDPALKTIPLKQKAAMFLNSFKYIKKIFRTANERGVTFMYDAGMNTTLKALLEAYLMVNQATVRIGAAQVCNTIEDAKKLAAFIPPAQYSDIYISHVKVISDGSNQGLTGYQSEPYLCNPKDNYGIYNFGKEKQPLQAPEEFKQLMKEIITHKGWPVMIHANGNLAIQFAIEMFQEYIPTPVQGVRHRIEHCSLTNLKELKIMKQLEISPSFLIGHVGYWGYAFEKAIFGDKSIMLDLCNSALKAGMKITLHSDNQVTPLGPLRMMEQSVTRKMEADPKHSVLNAPECITAEQALTAITYDAAWQCYAEQWTGSLKVGNFADFVVLKQDPLTVKDPYMHIRNIEVLETWLAGAQVYAGKVSKEVSMA